MPRPLPSVLLVVWLAVAGSGCGPAPSAPPAFQSPTAASLPSVTGAPSAVLPDLLADLHWLGRAAFRLDGPPVIYFDPAVSSFREEPPQADIILISHSHNDHYLPSALKDISRPETVLITSQTVATLLAADGIPGQVQVLRPGEQTTVGDVQIEAVPAYNIGKSYHPKAAGNLGFIVTVRGTRIYFAGDTDLIPEMADIQADVALLPVGGTYTMDVQEAAQAAAILKPQVAVPMHTLDADLEQFRGLCTCPVVILEEE